MNPFDLTDADVDKFRRHPGTFADMVRNIYWAGAQHAYAHAQTVVVSLLVPTSPDTDRGVKMAYDIMEVARRQAFPRQGTADETGSDVKPLASPDNL